MGVASAAALISPSASVSASASAKLSITQQPGRLFGPKWRRPADVIGPGGELGGISGGGRSRGRDQGGLGIGPNGSCQDLGTWGAQRLQFSHGSTGRWSRDFIHHSSAAFYHRMAPDSNWLNGRTFFPAASCLIRSAVSRERTLPIGTSETENQLVSLGLLTRETTAAIRSGPSDAIQSATMASISPLLYSGLGALHPPSRWPRRLGRVSRAVHRDNRSSLASINKWIQRCGSQCQF